MVNFTVLAGGTSAYIASYLFNTDANTLTFVNNATSIVNPLWLMSHPTNKSIL